jgi:hypothetical protein
MWQHFAHALGWMDVLLCTQLALSGVSNATHVCKWINRVDVTHHCDEISFHSMPRTITQQS